MTTLRHLLRDENLFWEAFLLSLGVHLFISWRAGEFTLHYQQKHTVEIDLTNIGHAGMSAPARKAALKPTARPKEWVKPAPLQKMLSAPIPSALVPAPVAEEPRLPEANAMGNEAGEYSIGTGNDNAQMLSRIPQLLNLSDLRAILQRFYPDEARRQGREGTVVLDVHIDTDGHVTSVDMARSGGSDFDAAAKKAAGLLRFTPAFLGSRRVGVKMRQAIQFKLEK